MAEILTDVTLKNEIKNALEKIYSNPYWHDDDDRLRFFSEIYYGNREALQEYITAFKDWTQDDDVMISLRNVIAKDFGLDPQSQLVLMCWAFCSGASIAKFHTEECSKKVVGGF